MDYPRPLPISSAEAAHAIERLRIDFQYILLPELDTEDVEKDYEPPSGWRDKVLLLLKKSLIPKDFPNPNRSADFLAGQAYGALVNLKALVSGADPRASVGAAIVICGEEALSKGFSEKAQAEEAKLMAELNPGRTLSEQQEFLEGQQSVIGYYVGASGKLSETTATKRHILMLLLAERLEQKKSVEEMYDVLSSVLGQDKMNSLDSFRQFCSSIGLRGSKYNVHKNRN